MIYQIGGWRCSRPPIDWLMAWLQATLDTVLIRRPTAGADTPPAEMTPGTPPKDFVAAVALEIQRSVAECYS